VNGCREVVRLIKADLPAFRRTIAESDIMAFLAGVVMFIIFLIGMAFTLRIL